MHEASGGLQQLGRCRRPSARVSRPRARYRPRSTGNSETLELRRARRGVSSITRFMRNKRGQEQRACGMRMNAAGALYLRRARARLRRRGNGVAETSFVLGARRPDDPSVHHNPRRFCARWGLVSGRAHRPSHPRCPHRPPRTFALWRHPPAGARVMLWRRQRRATEPRYGSWHRDACRC